MATTWVETPTPAGGPRSVRVSSGACTTGTEAKPADGDSSAGINLDGIGAVSVHAEAGGAFTAGGVLEVYVQNTVTGKWNKRLDLQMVLESVAGQMFYVAEVGTRVGRLAVVPVGAGIAAVYTLLGDFRER